MELTKANIVNRINKQVVNYRVTWDDIVDDLDEAIEEINSYMSTKYPPVSKILDYYSPPEKTYSFRAGGVDVNFFPEKYFTSIVISFVITKILTRDEEFSTIFSYHSNRYQENLFIMARDEMNNIPYQFISAPKGVYFANPDPQFKQDPEKYFNRKIVMDIPKIRVFYSWGNYKSMIPFNTQTFIEKPLPKDPNAYETGFKYMPIMMAGENYSTYIVDYSRKVLGVFLGWSLKDDNKAEGIVQNPIDLFEDTTFYAVFDLDIIGIEYNGNGGTIHNWRPTYVTKSEFNVNSLTPMGGTAFRKGYRFVGFELEKTNEFKLEEEYDGFEEQNDVVAEPGAIFKALWYKMIYKISYVGAKGNFTTTKINYTFGQEFDLDIPVQNESEPDEFIGWWDNPKFLGDRITKINESDYGDKTFYANYNQEKYRIRWLHEDGTLLKEDFLTRGSILTAPENVVKDNAFIDGLLYRFEYRGFIDEYNEPFQANQTWAKRNTNLKVVFSKPIEVETELFINYNVKKNGVIVTEQVSIKKQVGTVVKVDSDILQYLNNADLNTYEDLESVQQFAKSISFIKNGTTEEKEYTSDMTFTMEEEKPYEVICNYDTSSWTVNFKKKNYSNGEYSLGDLAGTHSFADNTTKSTIENKGASFLGILYEVTLNTGAKEYLQGFKVLGEGDIETDMPDNIKSDLTLVPYYGPTVNTAFVKKLKLEGMPAMNDPEGKEVITQYYRIGTKVSLLNIKQLTETNQYKYMKIDKFFSTSSNGALSGEISSNEITLNNDTTLYIRTESKELYSVIYKNYSSSGEPYTFHAIKYYPFNFESGNISFNVQANHPEITIYQGIEYVHKGWSLTDGGAYNELNVTLFRDRGEDLILYPIFVKLGKIIINFRFKTNTGTPLLTNYTLNSAFKKILTFDKLGSNVELYSQYSTFIGDLNYHNATLSLDRSIQPQQIGYNFNGYKVDGGTLETTMPIMVNLMNVNQSEIENKDKEMTIEIELIRNTEYAHLLIGEYSKPNGSLNSNEYLNFDGMSIPTEIINYQRNKFIKKGLTINELISNKQIPALSPHNGQTLYYCYQNPLDEYSTIDITYSAPVVDDMEIFVKDTVQGLHQFRIIYRESNGQGGFTILKTMLIYPNQLVQYGSVWDFNINAHKPSSDPEKYGYIFKGYSAPDFSPGVAATIHRIDTDNTEDIYYTAVYSPFGQIHVKFKVKAESGNLLTNYDLTGDYNYSNMNTYAFDKIYQFNERANHRFYLTELLQEFKDYIGYNERAQMGYDVVGFRVDYPAGVVGVDEYSYQASSLQSPNINLTTVLDSAIDGKSCDIICTFILRRKSGYVRVEVLENSVPNGTETVLDYDSYPYGKFFMQWGETFINVWNDFESSYGPGQNPISNMTFGHTPNTYFYRYDEINQVDILVENSFQASSSMPQSIQIFAKDDI